MSRPLQHQAEDLSRLLSDDIVKVVGALGIDVQREDRRKLYAFAPWGGHHKAKLEIETYPRPGKWNDWVGGLFGDALDLVACVLGNGAKDRKAAYAWALSYLGLDGAYDQGAHQRRCAEAAKRAEAREAKARRELNDARKTAFGRWIAAPLIKPGDTFWRYFQERRIELGQLPHQPRALRVSNAEPYYDGGEQRFVGPCILAAMTLVDGRFGSLHRTWIDPDRPGEKQDFSWIHKDAKARKMWPSSEGAAIRIWRGASGLPEVKAAKQAGLETVVVCEGLETGLSIALMTPELRVHCAGSLPGLYSYVPPKCARRILVAADNDWNRPQAEALLARSVRRLEQEFKLSVGVRRSPEGSDFNDLLRSKA